MTRFHSSALAIALALAPALSAQQTANAPHIGFIYPAGGRQGSTVEVTVGGQFLDGASDIRLTGKGVQASIVKTFKPLTQGQANRLREELQELQDKRKGTPDDKGVKPGPFTAADEKRVTEIRAKLADFVRRPASPAIAETVTVKLTISPDAALGEREMRILTTAGFTNPLALHVGQLQEYSRPVLKVPPSLVVVNGATPPPRFTAREQDAPMQVTLPAVVNGQMMPGGVDQVRFQATKGQRLVISAAARELIPYISDAVPGWFQAVITLRDPAGKEVASADHYTFHPDPVLFYDVPADGEYRLDIHDSIYRGREDFVYRISMGELPFLTGIFPMGGKAGAKNKIKAHGYNLPDAALNHDTKGKAKGNYPVTVHSGKLVSNPLPYAVDTLPEVIAGNGISRKEKAQKVKLPVVVNGRIEHPGEASFFRFDGQAGEQIVAEVYARRLESPLDSVLRLFDNAGKELASNDDYEDKGAALITHQADSRILFKLPARGTYYLQIADTQRKGGPEYGYRLRIGRPQPDYELRVVPSTLNARAGTTVPITVYALRRDGFAGDISLKLKDAPAGFLLSGGFLPGDQDKVRLTLTVPPNKAGGPLVLHMEGTSSIDGKQAVRNAVPAEDMMQAFAYHHLVTERDWLVRVVGAGRNAVGWKPMDKIMLPVGGMTNIRLYAPNWMVTGMKVTLSDPPEGIFIQDVIAAPDGVTVVVRSIESKVKPGMKGNLLMEAFVERPGATKAVTNARRQPVGIVPAIPFEIVPAQSAAR